MRQNRQLKKGATYHVIAKVNHSDKLFTPKEIKDLFLQIVARAKKKYKFELKNFVIMENHIHFLIKPMEDESLSKILQWILGVFAIYYNNEHEIKGHFWQGRFFSRIVEGMRQFEDAFRYICNNPVTANLVKQAIDYVYSGFYHIKKDIFDIVEEPDPEVKRIISEMA